MHKSKVMKPNIIPTIEVLGGNLRENLCDYGLDKDFLGTE
jgi:hypothetical protein